jgi:hypothetical protein
MAARSPAGAPSDCPLAAWRNSARTEYCGASTTETASASGAPTRNWWPDLRADVASIIPVSPCNYHAPGRPALTSPFATCPRGDPGL